MAVRTDPGSPTCQHDDEEGIDGRMCKKCNSPKPPRAHHCSICGRCILKMDHHCPWVNNCVGLGNYRYFFCFLLWVTIATFYLCLITSPYLFSEGGVLYLPLLDVRDVLVEGVQATLSSILSPFSSSSASLRGSVTGIETVIGTGIGGGTGRALGQVGVGWGNQPSRDSLSRAFSFLSMLLSPSPSLSSSSSSLPSRFLSEIPASLPPTLPLPPFQPHPVRFQNSFLSLFVSPFFTSFSLTRPPQSRETQDMALLAVFILSSAVCFAVGFLFLFHLYLVLSGFTTIEFYEGMMIKNRFQKENRPYVHPFDQGVCINFQQVMGRGNWLLSLLPSTRPPPPAIPPGLRITYQPMCRLPPPPPSF